MAVEPGAKGGEGRRPPRSVTHALPNGLTVACFNKREVDFVYREIFEGLTYIKHGIALGEEPCVFDVGANIGLFTLFVKRLRPRATVHAFEPSPDLFALLRANTAAHDDSVVRHECGLSSRDGEAAFTFYPGYSILSSFHADAQRDQVMLRVALRNQFRSLFGDGVEPEDRHLDALIEEMLRNKTTSVCRLRTLSGVIDEHRVEAIDLLKIDAEKSEGEILAGIEDRHWPAIRQIVLEVHDSDGSRLAGIEAILGHRGFRTQREQDPQFRDTGIFNLYAMR